MMLSVEPELKQICVKIVAQRWSEQEWALREADDWFQTERYEGGYDATEEAFCFSYYAPDSKEYWFQVTLAEVEDIVAGSVRNVAARPATS